MGRTTEYKSRPARQSFMDVVLSIHWLKPREGFRIRMGRNVFCFFFLFLFLTWVTLFDGSRDTQQGPLPRRELVFRPKPRSAGGPGAKAPRGVWGGAPAGFGAEPQPPAASCPPPASFGYVSTPLHQRCYANGFIARFRDPTDYPTTKIKKLEIENVEISAL